MLELFAKMVQYEQDIKSTTFDHKLYNTLPTIFIKIENSSKLHSGFILLKSLSRHDMDSNSRKLVNINGKIVLMKNDYVLLLLHNIIPI